MDTQASSHPSLSLRHRFVRLNPRFDRDETLRLLTSEINLAQHGNANDNRYPLPVPWLNSSKHQLEFFAIPGDFRLNQSTSFQSGRVYGMDVTSGAAVATLLFDLFDSEKPTVSSENANEKTEQHGSCAPLRILDLCCAPGIKLCMLADLSPPSSTLVGVDISPHRISLCKNIIKKYHIEGNTSASAPKSTNNDGATTDTDEKSNVIQPRVTIRLYCADGTTFGTNQTTTSTNTVKPDLVFDNNAAVEDFISSGGKRKRMNKSARAREKRRLLELQRSEASVGTNNTESVDDHTSNLHYESLSAEKREAICRSNEKEKLNEEDDIGSDPEYDFDRVIVDAECSTDGAMRHNGKRPSALPSKACPTWNDTNMDELIDLQKRLIDSGFRLLKRGGVMVYSTCSLSSKQNEEVVQWLLEKCQDAFIIPVSFLMHKKSSEDLPFIEEGSIPGTVRFNPVLNSKSLLVQGSGFFLAKIGKMNSIH